MVSGPHRGSTNCTLRNTLLGELGELSEHVEAISSSLVMSHGIYILAGEIDNAQNELGIISAMEKHKIGKGNGVWKSFDILNGVILEAYLRSHFGLNHLERPISFPF